MTRRHSRSVGSAVLAAVTLVGVGHYLRADNPDRRTTKPATRSLDLGGPDRFLSYVSTDKPIYRRGEKVYVRGVILRADTRAPAKADQQAQAVIEIRGPKGDVVGGGTVSGQDSVVGFAWPIPDGQSGGEYTVKVMYPFHGYPPAERKFDIRAYRAPRLKSQIVFLRDGYGPGDEVQATLHVDRAEGGVPSGAKVTASGRVDGQEIYTGTVGVDEQGNCSVSFLLPAQIARGEGTLSFVIEDGGVVETAAKTIPILMQTVDLQLYPEGGELIAGLPTRVYLEAKTPAHKPADVAGVVVDANGTEVAAFRTEHEGRGRFSFTPRKDGRYTLKLTEPAGIKTSWPLPEVKTSGAVIGTVSDVTPAGEPIRLKVGSTTNGRLTVSLQRREVEVASLKLDTQAGSMADVTLTPPDEADGILIATVWDATGKPLAERLVFRRPARSLRIKVTPGTEPEAQASASFVPGDKVNLAIQTTDNHGEPVSAVVGLTVTDDSVLEMIDKREQAPRLPVMVLLESDVRELADAHVYLDPENPEAPLATDLLLGTQGWRRFAFFEMENFLAAHGDAARRVLAHRRPEAARHMRFFGRVGGMGGMGVVVEGVEMMDGAIDLSMVPARGVNGVEAFGDRAGVDVNFDALVVANAPVPAVDEPVAEQKIAGLKRARNGFRFAETQPALMHEVEGEMMPSRNDLVAVRVYAHEARPNRQPADRRDFTETLYWNAGVRTDPKTGKASVSFALSDAVTTFRVFADAFSDSGALGQGIAAVESVEPFYMEPKLPLEVTSGDVILMPLGLVNGLSKDLPRVEIKATGAAALSISEIEPFSIKAKGRDRRLLNVSVGHMNGASDFVVEAKAGPHGDKVARPLAVKPRGFPIEVAFGGMLEPGAVASHTINIPRSFVNHSLASTVAVYPTPLANMTEALERLIQEPNGCFEQTSSSCYPLVMAQQYFMSHTGVEPALIERSRTMLDKGYARLMSFECKQRGYEWFGGDPGHEALTAYGLLEFTDMAQVRAVDPQMLARTREWLLKRRDGKGGFTLDSKALDSFGRAPADTTAAYITWALLEAGEKGLQPELSALAGSAAASQDSYIVALAANALALAEDAAGAKKMREALIKKQSANGSVPGAKTSITCSGGEALTIEATSLAVLAWLHDPACAAAVEKSIRFLADSCKAGRYGSTQSTVLALRAIVTYDRSRAKPKAAGTVQLTVDGHPIGGEIPFGTSTRDAIRLPDISEVLSAGEHKIELKMNGGSSMPYSFAVRYYDTQPPSAPDCKVRVEVSLASDTLTEGAVTEANVVVTNRTREGVPMVVAIVGLPGGLEPRHDQLKELVKAGTVAAYEVIGREVVLYWRELKPAQEVRFPISLIAAVPGSYTAPASRAYLYYTDEHKTWAPGPRVQIRPKSTE
ncbi:MAG: hypothetical protein AMXMBFR13_30370 [Phycisphaerae bacterium]